MKRVIRIVFYTAIIVSVVWCILTLIVEMRGPKKSWDLGDRTTTDTIFVYDPDPFYNLDEQVCLAFADVLATNGIRVKVASVSAAVELKFSDFDAYVFCTNTYNWQPDWALTKYIHDQKSLNRKPIIAITLGSGSTITSQKKFEQLIIRQEGKIIGSRSLWLMRPNDETRLEEPNVQVAISMVRKWAAFIAPKLRHS